MSVIGSAQPDVMRVKVYVSAVLSLISRLEENPFRNQLSINLIKRMAPSRRRSSASILTSPPIERCNT